MAETSVKMAVELSISQDRRVALYADETISGWNDQVRSTLEALEEFGLEDHARENDGSEDAWGTHESKEWRVRIIDGLSGRHERDA